MLEFCTIIKFEYTSGNERVYFAPSSGFPPTLTSTPSHDHHATISLPIRSGLIFSRYLWSRHLSRLQKGVIMWHPMGSSTRVVFKRPTSSSAHPLHNILREKRPLYFRELRDTRSSRQNGVSGLWGRKNTAHTFTQAAPTDLKLGERCLAVMVGWCKYGSVRGEDGVV